MMISFMDINANEFIDLFESNGLIGVRKEKVYSF